jgi:two-component system NtrC family sensor kinase
MDFDEGYRLATEHSNEGVVIVSGNKRLFINQRCIELAGYHTAQEFDKIPFLSTVHPDDRKKVKEIIRKRQSGKPAPSLYEFRFLRPDGSIIYVEISSCSITYMGQPASLGYLRDISDHKQIEENLRQSEERYRNILESIQEGYFELDLDGNYTFANEANCRYLGYTKEELIGMNNRQFQDETVAQKMYQLFRRLYRTGEPVKALDVEIIRKNGTKGFNEISVSLIRDAEGKPIGFRGVSRDITERKQAEEIILRSEKRFKALYQESPIPTFTWQKKGDDFFLIDFNRAAILLTEGKTSKYMGKSAQEMYRKRPEIIDDMIRCFKEQSVISRELVSQDFAPERLLFVYYSNIPPDLIIVHTEDITERKRADDALKKNREELIKKNQELEESRKNVQLTLERLGTAYEELKTTQAKILQQEKMASIGQLAAGVAHEINNPMAFIASNLGTLDKYIRRLKDFIRTQSEAIKSLKATDAIEKLEKKRKELKLDYTIDDIDLLVKESLDGSERVQKIVQELNRFSRVDDAEYKDTNINECMESSINIVWNELQHKATLHKDYGNLPPTKCYPQKLNQVFINLLINAIQAIEKKGKIKIKTWEKDGSIWVTVSDTGCGIPRENQSKIFEPFFTTKEVGKGTGLGLSISYEIMQRHKGEISFESKEGKGTAFTIRMPIV